MTEVREDEAPQEPEEPDAKDEPRGWKRYRWVLVVVLFVALWLVGHFTGLKDELDAEKIRDTIEGAGLVGVLIFMGVFAVGELLHVPGLVFVAAAMFAYGRVEGALVSLAGAIVSVCVSFVVVRTVGGQPLQGFKRPFFKKMLSHLEERPIRITTILRLILWMAPPLNYALAMSSIKFRHYLIGSTLGLIPPVLLAAVFFDWLFR
ncbi:MAG: TVP38/TMEM64 family protein [Polyangiales bacterium]